MYKVFDSFLNVPTWYTCHKADEGRFFIALNSVVKKGNFSPDDMASYMREKLGVNRDDDDYAAFDKAIDHYTAAAWAVKDYLIANNL